MVVFGWCRGVPMAWVTRCSTSLGGEEVGEDLDAAGVALRLPRSASVTFGVLDVERDVLRLMPWPMRGRGVAGVELVCGSVRRVPFGCGHADPALSSCSSDLRAPTT